MLRLVAWLAFLCAAISTPLSLADDGDEPQAPRVSRDVRMQLMRSRVAALKAVGPNGNAQSFSNEPAVRYNDTPRGVVDASIWILGGGRPPAVLVLEYYDNNTVMYELTANENPPKSVQGAGWEWRPLNPEFQWVRIPLDAPPGATARLRQSQLKLLIRDIAASEEFNEQTHALRVLPRAIHEYEDEANGVLYGAVFVIANGTNAEILMFVEARSQEGETPAHWVAGFSRLATASLDVTYQDRPFWSSAQEPEYSPNRPLRIAAPYFSQGDILDSEERNAFQRQ